MTTKDIAVLINSKLRVETIARLLLMDVSSFVLEAMESGLTSGQSGRVIDVRKILEYFCDETTDSNKMSEIVKG